jgi:two-component system LytT family sensor kinase
MLLPLYLYIRFLKRRAFLYHSFFWTGMYLLWVVVFRRYSFSVTKTMTIEFCYLIFITVDYYAISNFIIPQFLLKRKYALFFTSALTIIVLSGWLRALVAVQMNLHFFHPTQITNFGTLYLNSVLNISLWLSLIIMLKMMIDRLQTQRQLDLLETERIKNELDYLKAQINPHALFNSLNTIYGHIDKSNQVARNILLDFSELLRYQLYDCSAEKICLEKEMGYIKSYVDFQRLRKEEKLVVALQIENMDTSLQIAPLLLVILVENAFKFVSNFSDKENKIAIKIFTVGNILYSSFTNTKELQEASLTKTSNGIGMINLKRRLELVYPQKYELTTNAGSDYYEANLIIDLV